MSMSIILRAHFTALSWIYIKNGILWYHANKIACMFSFIWFYNLVNDAHFCPVPRWRTLNSLGSSPSLCSLDLNLYTPILGVFQKLSKHDIPSKVGLEGSKPFFSNRKSTYSKLRDIKEILQRAYLLGRM